MLLDKVFSSIKAIWILFNSVDNCPSHLEDSFTSHDDEEETTPLSDNEVEEMATFCGNNEDLGC